MPSRSGVAAAVAASFALLGVATSAASAAVRQYPAAAQLQCTSALGGLDTPSTARGGRREGTAMQTVTPDSTIPAGETPRLAAAFSATVPVYFHVVAKNRTPAGGWITDAQINAQIDVLNQSYSGGNGGPDTGFRFTLAGVDRTVNKRWFDIASSGAERDMKRALKQGGSTDLNIYSTSADGLWASPTSRASSRSRSTRSSTASSSTSIPSRAAARRTTTWAGRRRTRSVTGSVSITRSTSAACGRATPSPTRRPSGPRRAACPMVKDTCPSPGEDPIHNYMDYSYDTCYTEFTPGQAAREQTQYTFWRLRYAN